MTVPWRSSTSDLWWLSIGASSNLILYTWFSYHSYADHSQPFSALISAWLNRCCIFPGDASSHVSGELAGHTVSQGRKSWASSGQANNYSHSLLIVQIWPRHIDLPLQHDKDLSISLLTGHQGLSSVSCHHQTGLLLLAPGRYPPECHPTLIQTGKTYFQSSLCCFPVFHPLAFSSCLYQIKNNLHHVSFLPHTQLDLTHHPSRHKEDMDLLSSGTQVVKWTSPGCLNCQVSVFLQTKPEDPPLH